jgi:hypothetical protein
MHRAFAVLLLLAAPASAELLPARSCTDEVKSGVGPPTTIRFANGTDRPVQVHWRSANGPIRYGKVEPGQTFDQGTYATHVWSVTDEGTCLAVFVADATPRTALVSPADAAHAVAVDTSPPPPKDKPVADMTAKTTLSPPPAALGLSSFYKKHLDAAGMPIVSSARVPDRALTVAREVVLGMLSGRPDLQKRLAASRVRVALIAVDEVTVDIPEHADLYEAFPGTDWNERARGLGATTARPASSVGTENVLCLASNRSPGESILVHEFAHTIYAMGLAPHEPKFVTALAAAYHDAMARGLWKDTYAAANMNEYWAEGVQSWFDTNLQSDPPNGVHGPVNTRAELVAYDPALAKLVAQVFPADAWRYSCPK